MEVIDFNTFKGRRAFAKALRRHFGVKSTKCKRCTGCSSLDYKYELSGKDGWKLYARVDTTYTVEYLRLVDGEGTETKVVNGLEVYPSFTQFFVGVAPFFLNPVGALSACLVEDRNRAVELFRKAGDRTHGKSYIEFLQEGLS